jgi:hypothetical protein
MTLTPTQQERLRYLLEDEWVDEADEEHSLHTFRKQIGAMERPEELHIFAGNFNWDCGWEELVVVLEHPKCDYGTALMVYWLAQPDYFYRKTEIGKSLRLDETDTWNRVKWLEGRLLAGEYTHRQIAFDPGSVIGRAITGSDSYRPGLRLVPQMLWNPSPGNHLSLKLADYKR